jgi:hypothetical protein
MFNCKAVIQGYAMARKVKKKPVPIFWWNAGSG